MKNTAIIFALLALAAGGASAAGVAAMPGPTASVTVATHDLDLGTAAGRSALQHRIALAAAEVCGEASASDPAGRRAIRACRSATIERATIEVAIRQAAGRLAAR